MDHYVAAIQRVDTRVINALAVLVILLLLSVGCSTNTTVVLVPDHNGKVGKVLVTGEHGQSMLAQARESTEISSSGKTPSPSKVLSLSEVRETFAAAMDNEPSPPQRYVVHFQIGTVTLSADVQHKLEDIARKAKEKGGCDLSVIGHTDSVGDATLNRKLSKQRANNVKQTLVGLGVAAKCMRVRYFGEQDPLIPTADGVVEPRNRRVEVEIR